MKTEVTMMTPSGKAFTNNKPTLLKYGREFGINSEYKFPNTITPTNNNALVPVSSSFNDVKKYETPKNPYLKKSRQAIIAGRLMRIRAEIKQLDNQLNQSNAQQQQSGESNKDELESLQALKG